MTGEPPSGDAAAAGPLGRSRGPTWMHGIATCVAALPYRWLRPLGLLVGAFVAGVLRIRRAHAERALAAAAIARPKHVAARVYASLATGLFELFWIAGRPIDAARTVVTFRPEARAAFERALARGRGVVIATAHTGNWDLTACAAAQLQASRGGPPLHVVTKRLSWKALDRFWQELRARRGIVLLEARGATRAVAAALARGAPVALIVDQAPDRAGRPAPRRAAPSGVVALPFLGRTALHDVAPVALAARAKAPIVVAVGHRAEDGRHVVDVLDVLDPDDLRDRPAAVRRIASVVERFIVDHPDQWLWLHRRWKGVPHIQENPCLVAVEGVS